jgi:hypothetical protein
MQQRRGVDRQPLGVGDRPGGVESATQVAAQDAGQGHAAQTLGNRCGLRAAAIAERGIGGLHDAGGIQGRFAVANKQNRHDRYTVEVNERPGPAADPASWTGPFAPATCVLQG